MCLEIKNSDYCVLSFDGYYIGYKRFRIAYQNKLAILIPYYSYAEKHYYKFKKTGSLLMVEPNNREQNILLFLNIKDGGFYNYETSITKEYKLGYHILQFPIEKPESEYFDIFNIENNTAILPVIFADENVQMIGDGIVVHQFGIPNSNIYFQLCKQYGVFPNKKVKKFLTELFNSY
jgi:hypothetical protein